MSYVLLFIEKTYYLYRNFFFNFQFFCYILILLVNSKQNILIFKLNPLSDKKTTHMNKSCDLFLLYLYKGDFTLGGISALR